MLKREKLNTLVVKTLNARTDAPRALTLFEAIRQEDPKILRAEKVRSFRSFVKIINSFEEIRQTGTGVCCYTLKKEFREIRNI